MNKFRASYTVLNTWASGNWEQAIKWYFHLDQFVTPAMVAGRALHSEWEKFIIENGRLPEVFGSRVLKSPKPEIKIVAKIQDWLDLVGIIDCYDDGTIYEFKSGKMTSEAHASSKQAGLYGMLALMHGLPAEKAEIYHFDQYTKRSDMSIVHITAHLLNNSLEWVETISSEMHAYFTENKLYERFARPQANN